MNARIIYLQSDFWKQLRSDTSIAGIRCLMNVYDAMLESELRTDISDDDWDSDEYLVLLWKRYTSGQSSVELYDNLTFDSIEDNVEDLSAIYLTNKSDTECESLGLKYGVFAINTYKIPKKEHIFKGDGFLLKKNCIKYDDRYMQFQSKMHYPCNAIIMIDPYILTKEQNIENNLYSLLEAILPNKKLQVKLQISIFTMIGDKNCDAVNGNSKFNGESAYNRIRNIIAALRKGLNFDLSLYAIGPSEEFHSRMVITNNVQINAEDGFEVFKDDGKSNKNARFEVVMPRLTGDSRQDMSNYLRWIKIAKDRSRKQSETQIWGKCENRLFELV